MVAEIVPDSSHGDVLPIGMDAGVDESEQAPAKIRQTHDLAELVKRIPSSPPTFALDSRDGCPPKRHCREGGLCQTLESYGWQANFRLRRAFAPRRAPTP
jgi:hypothetical protein